MPALDSVERPSPAARKQRCNYNKAIAFKQQLPEPQSSKRKLSGFVPRSFLFFQDPKQRHDTAQSLQPPVQTHPCKEHALHSWDNQSKLWWNHLSQHIGVKSNEPNVNMIYHVCKHDGTCWITSCIEEKRSKVKLPTQPSMLTWRWKNMEDLS